MTLRLFFLLLAFLAIQVATVPPAAAAPPATGMRRIAVLVGANDPPPGRQALRFAHDDANELAEVLQRVGAFAAGDVHVLLDPHPADLLAAIDAAAQVAAGADVMFVFYYSGHSDGQALFPHGEAISLADVRSRIEHLRARIRVGILDTCRGGSWTQSKGLTVGPPLDMADLMNVETEGTALVSSSSGFEDAHEASDVHGSFFTHYFAAGLRGAADRAGDGNVTLQEAYEYARERTVRDSARLAKTPQHPSFEIGLHGRQDIVLTVLSQSTSALAITATRAPMEIIQLSSGVTVADAPQGQPVRIALPPGRYLVRSVIDGQVYTKEVEVRPGETATLADGQLEAVGSTALAMKGPGPVMQPLSLWSSPRGDRWLLSLRFGVGSGAEAAPPANISQGPQAVQSLNSFTFGYDLWYRVTDRLSWNVPWPALSYRFGDPGGVEVMPYLGLASNSWNSATGLSLALKADVAAQIWTARGQRILLQAGVVLPPYKDSASPLLGVGMGDEVEPYLSAGYAWTFAHTVTLSGGIGVNRDYSSLSGPGWQYESEWVRLGAGVAVRVAPNASVNLSGSWSTETHAGLGSYAGFTIGPTISF
jgi:hypothetical protein